MDKIHDKPSITNNSNDENRLLAFIHMYSKRIGEHKSNADLSCELLEMGTKTELAQKLEEALVNPIGAIAGIKRSVDGEVLGVVDNLCKIFFSKAKEDNLINTAFRQTNDNQLRYGIVLKNDTFKTRNAIFSFLNFYSTLDLSEQVRVHFQFIPESVLDRIDNKEYVA